MDVDSGGVDKGRQCVGCVECVAGGRYDVELQCWRAERRGTTRDGRKKMCTLLLKKERAEDTPSEGSMLLYDMERDEA